MPTEELVFNFASSFFLFFCPANSAKFGFVAMWNVSNSRAFWKAQVPSQWAAQFLHPN